MKKITLIAALFVTNIAMANQETYSKEIDQLKSQINVLADQIENSTSNSKLSKLSFGGYGEHHLNIKEGSDNAIDIHRFVMFSGYKFNDTVSLQTELEVEHGLVGEGKPGEVEVEQAFINVKLSPSTDLKLGQFLIPVGFLNETHEPDTFYGVERPGLEKQIIPTTWWEAGAMVSVKSDLISVDAAIHSGLDVTYDEEDKKGDFKAIRKGRQKNAKATANTPALTTRVNIMPAAGVQLGATLNYQHDITQGDGDVSAILGEAHAKLNSGPLSVKALYGKWKVDIDEASYESQSGWYVEPAIKLTDKLGVFTRYSDYKYSGGIDGGVGTQKNEAYLTVGANYWIHKKVALKIDRQNKQNSDSDSVNVGIGWSY